MFSTRPEVETVLVNDERPEFAASVVPSASVCSAISLLERFVVPSRNRSQ
jgi:hypothetical protein